MGPGLARARHAAARPLTRHGACWDDAHAKICAWSDEAALLRAQAAPWTDFHALLGADVLGGGHMGTYEYFRFDSARLVDHNPHETLFAVRMRGWDVEYPDADMRRPGKRTDAVASTFYALCSRTRPALIYRNQPGKGRRLMTTFAPGSATSVSGATTLVNTEYAAACHARGDALPAREGIALGYSPDASATLEETPVAAPADALK